MKDSATGKNAIILNISLFAATIILVILGWNNREKFSDLFGKKSVVNSDLVSVDTVDLNKINEDNSEVTDNITFKKLFENPDGSGARCLSRAVGVTPQEASMRALVQAAEQFGVKVSSTTEVREGVVSVDHIIAKSSNEISAFYVMEISFKKKIDWAEASLDIYASTGLKHMYQTIEEERKQLVARCESLENTIREKELDAQKLREQIALYKGNQENALKKINKVLYEERPR